MNFNQCQDRIAKKGQDERNKQECKNGCKRKSLSVSKKENLFALLDRLQKKKKKNEASGARYFPK